MATTLAAAISGGQTDNGGLGGDCDGFGDEGGDGFGEGGGDGFKKDKGPRKQRRKRTACNACYADSKQPCVRSNPQNARSPCERCLENGFQCYDTPVNYRPRPNHVRPVLLQIIPEVESHLRQQQGAPELFRPELANIPRRELYTWLEWLDGWVQHLTGQQWSEVEYAHLAAPAAFPASGSDAEKRFQAAEKHFIRRYD